MTRFFTALTAAVVALTAGAAWWLTGTEQATASPQTGAATARALAAVEMAAEANGVDLTVPDDISLMPLCDRFDWALDYGFDSRIAYHLTVSEAVLRLQVGGGEAQRAVAHALVVDLYSAGGLCTLTGEGL